MGHDKYISGSFDPGSIKHTTVAEKYRCAGLWEETFLPSLGDNCFLAKGFCSAAPSVRDACGDVGAVVCSCSLCNLKVSESFLRVLFSNGLGYLL